MILFMWKTQTRKQRTKKTKRQTEKQTLKYTELVAAREEVGRGMDELDKGDYQSG